MIKRVIYLSHFSLYSGIYMVFYIEIQLYRMLIVIY